MTRAAKVSFRMYQGLLGLDGDWLFILRCAQSNVMDQGTLLDMGACLGIVRLWKSLFPECGLDCTIPRSADKLAVSAMRAGRVAVS